MKHTPAIVFIFLLFLVIEALSINRVQPSGVTTEFGRSWSSMARPQNRRDRTGSVSVKTVYISGRFAQGWTQLGLPTIGGPQSLIGSGACPGPPYDPSIVGDFCSAAGCLAVIEGYSGGVVRTGADQMLLWGGGHDAYGGNEIYAVDATSPSRYHRIFGPTLPGPCACPSGPHSAVPMNSCRDPLGPPWAPISRHSYGGMAYIPAGADASHRNPEEMMIYSGAPTSGTGGCVNDFWIYDFSRGSSQNAWTKIPPANLPGLGACDDGSQAIAFDPTSRAVYVLNYGTFGVINPSTTTAVNLAGGRLAPLTYRKLVGLDFYNTSNSNAAIDLQNRLFVIITPLGESASSPVIIEEHGLTTPHQPSLYCTGPVGSVCSGTGSQSATGCPKSIPGTENASATYDTSLGKIVFYTPEDDDGIYIWNHDTHSCTRETYHAAGTATGALPSVKSTCGTGTQHCPRGSFGRFAYVSDKDYYIYVSDADRAPFVLCRKATGCGP